MISGPPTHPLTHPFCPPAIISMPPIGEEQFAIISTPPKGRVVCYDLNGSWKGLGD